MAAGQAKWLTLSIRDWLALNLMGSGPTTTNWILGQAGTPEVKRRLKIQGEPGEWIPEKGTGSLTGSVRVIDLSGVSTNLAAEVRDLVPPSEERGYEES